MADQWHYRLLGEDFGPVTESTLRSLIDDGTIGPSDEVRPAEAASWQRADTMIAPPVEEATSEPDVPMDLDALLAPSAEPNEHATKATTANDWFYRSEGIQHGPVDFDGLFEQVAAGSISSSDEILAPGGADWVMADSIVGLFPEQSSSEEPAPATALPPEDAPATLVEPDELDIDDVDDWEADYLSDPEPELEMDTTPEAASGPTEYVPELSAEPSDPDPPTSSSSATVDAAAAALAHLDQTPADESKPSRVPLTMPSLSPNLGAALGNPMVLGGVAVALLVVGLMFVPWGSLSSPDGGDLALQIDETWGQIKPLTERQTTDQEWEALASQIDPQLQQIAQEAIDRGAGPEAPVLEIVRSVAVDQIPKVLQSKQKASPTRIQMVDNLIGRAKELTE